MRTEAAARVAYLHTPGRVARLALGLGGLLLAATAVAHDFRVGDLVIDHPYAVPSPAGAANGAAYLRGIRNRGTVPDRLLGASTPVAQRIELHEMRMDGEVMRMREVPGIDLPPGQEVSLRHGQRYHFMLVKLDKPLAVGDRFEMTLRFEKAGEYKVPVEVQQPRAHHHGH